MRDAKAREAGVQGPSAPVVALAHPTRQGVGPPPAPDAWCTQVAMSRVMGEEEEEEDTVVTVRVSVGCTTVVVNIAPPPGVGKVVVREAFARIWDAEKEGRGAVKVGVKRTLTPPSVTTVQQEVSTLSGSILGLHEVQDQKLFVFM